jgi:hypothetical protein
MRNQHERTLAAAVVAGASVDGRSAAASGTARWRRLDAAQEIFGPGMVGAARSPKPRRIAPLRRRPGGGRRPGVVEGKPIGGGAGGAEHALPIYLDPGAEGHRRRRRLCETSRGGEIWGIQDLPPWRGKASQFPAPGAWARPILHAQAR